MNKHIDWLAIRTKIAAGTHQQSLSLTPGIVEQLTHYLQLLHHWNQAYNLTAIRDPEQMVVQHLFDSLSVAPYIQGHDCIDVGTGAGLPGLVLALTAPMRRWVLLDANGKKIRFLRQAVMELGLTNVDLQHQRVERFTPPQPFDTVVVRALAKIEDVWLKSRHLVAKQGCLLAMKAQSPRREIPPEGISGTQITFIPLDVPELVAERQLVKIEFTS